MEPSNSVVEVEDYVMATSQLAQTTLRSVVGSVELDEVLSSREKINHELQKIIDERTDPWGIKVSAVEVKELELPDGMKRAMARQAEAERESRAKIIAAEGELQAAAKLSQAAQQMEVSPVTLQLRYLQTIREISGVAFYPMNIRQFYYREGFYVSSCFYTSWRKRVEQRKPFYGLDRRPAVGQGDDRGAGGRQAAQKRGIRFRPRFHLGSETRR